VHQWNRHNRYQTHIWGWIVLNSVKINSTVWWIHDVDVKCNISGIKFPLHIFIQNWNLYQRSLLINIAQSLLYVPLIQLEIWNTWEINLAAFTHDTLSLLPFWHWFKSINSTTTTALYFAAPLSAVQFLHPVCQYFPAQREEAVCQQDLPGSKTTIYSQSPNFIHNLFLKT